MLHRMAYMKVNKISYKNWKAFDEVYQDYQCYHAFIITTDQRSSHLINKLISFSSKFDRYLKEILLLILKDFPAFNIQKDYFFTESTGIIEIRNSSIDR